LLLTIRYGAGAGSAGAQYSAGETFETTKIGYAAFLLRMYSEAP
jgi:hypothetical protein